MEVEGLCCGGKIRKRSAAGAPEDKLEMESNGSCDCLFHCDFAHSARHHLPGLPWFTTYILIRFTLMSSAYMIFQTWIPMANRHFCVC